MEPDSHSFLTLITKLQCHLAFGVGFFLPIPDSGFRIPGFCKPDFVGSFGCSHPNRNMICLNHSEALRYIKLVP